MKPGLIGLSAVTALGLWPVLAGAAPVFDCQRLDAGSIAERVCRDPALAQLDRQLADVFAAALKQARNERPPTLRAEQRGWIKGRDECWKSADVGACVTESYERRIAELQARYRLLPPSGPDRYACQGGARNEVLVSWFNTVPPTLYAERGDSVSLMFREPQVAGSEETRYIGRNESLRMRGVDQLWVRWGVGAVEMTCLKQR